LACSICGGSTDTKESRRMSYGINFCSEKCLNEFIEEFMLLAFEKIKINEKKLKELENRINLAMKSRKQKK
jgi:hypothetical protein